ncbi:MAG: hypothetical protein K0S07_992, partial [Chlamydiales bacterium]|nr:hypothetical protein [Chlamydiales bacterium]
ELQRERLFSLQGLSIPFFPFSLDGRPSLQSECAEALPLLDYARRQMTPLHHRHPFSFPQYLNFLSKGYVLKDFSEELFSYLPTRIDHLYALMQETIYQEMESADQIAAYLLNALFHLNEQSISSLKGFSQEEIEWLIREFLLSFAYIQEEASYLTREIWHHLSSDLTLEALLHGIQLSALLSLSRSGSSPCFNMRRHRGQLALELPLREGDTAFLIIPFAPNATIDSLMAGLRNEGQFPPLFKSLYEPSIAQEVGSGQSLKQVEPCEPLEQLFSLMRQDLVQKAGEALIEQPDPKLVQLGFLLLCRLLKQPIPLSAKIWLHLPKALCYESPWLSKRAFLELLDAWQQKGLESLKGTKRHPFCTQKLLQADSMAEMESVLFQQQQRPQAAFEEKFLQAFAHDTQAQDTFETTSTSIIKSADSLLQKRWVSWFSGKYSGGLPPRHLHVFHRALVEWLPEGKVDLSRYLLSQIPAQNIPELLERSAQTLFFQYALSENLSLFYMTEIVTHRIYRANIWLPVLSTLPQELPLFENIVENLLLRQGDIPSLEDPALYPIWEKIIERAPLSFSTLQKMLACKPFFHHLLGAKSPIGQKIDLFKHIFFSLSSSIEGNVPKERQSLMASCILLRFSELEGEAKAVLSHATLQQIKKVLLNKLLPLVSLSQLPKALEWLLGFIHDAEPIEPASFEMVLTAIAKVQWGNLSNESHLLFNEIFTQLLEKGPSFPLLTPWLIELSQIFPKLEKEAQVLIGYYLAHSTDTSLDSIEKKELYLFFFAAIGQALAFDLQGKFALGCLNSIVRKQPYVMERYRERLLRMRSKIVATWQQLPMQRSQSAQAAIKSLSKQGYVTDAIQPLSSAEKKALAQTAWEHCRLCTQNVEDRALAKEAEPFYQFIQTLGQIKELQTITEQLIQEQSEFDTLTPNPIVTLLIHNIAYIIRQARADDGEEMVKVTFNMLIYLGRYGYIQPFFKEQVAELLTLLSTKVQQQVIGQATFVKLSILAQKPCYEALEERLAPSILVEVNRELLGIEPTEKTIGMSLFAGSLNILHFLIAEQERHQTLSTAELERPIHALLDLALEQSLRALKKGLLPAHGTGKLWIQGESIQSYDIPFIKMPFLFIKSIYPLYSKSHPELLRQPIKRAIEGALELLQRKELSPRSEQRPLLLKAAFEISQLAIDLGLFHEERETLLFLGDRLLDELPKLFKNGQSTPSIASFLQAVLSSIEEKGGIQRRYEDKLLQAVLEGTKSRIFGQSLSLLQEMSEMLCQCQAMGFFNEQPQKLLPFLQQVSRLYKKQLPVSAANPLAQLADSALPFDRGPLLKGWRRQLKVSPQPLSTELERLSI